MHAGFHACRHVPLSSSCGSSHETVLSSLVKCTLQSIKSLVLSCSFRHLTSHYHTVDRSTQASQYIPEIRPNGMSHKAHLKEQAMRPHVQHVSACCLEGRLHCTDNPAAQARSRSFAGTPVPSRLLASDGVASGRCFPVAVPREDELHEGTSCFQRPCVCATNRY